MSLTSGESRALQNLTTSLATIASVLTAANENFVEFARTAANQNERIIEELKVANIPFDEDEAEARIRHMREITDAARELAEVTSTVVLWKVGDKVRVIDRSNTFFRQTGKIHKISENSVTVEFKEGDCKVVFDPADLLHQDAHETPMELGPEWHVGAKVRVVDHFTILHKKVGIIQSVSPTTVEANFGLTGAEFHPSQLEVVDTRTHKDDCRNDECDGMCTTAAQEGFIKGIVEAEKFRREYTSDQDKPCTDPHCFGDCMKTQFKPDEPKTHFTITKEGELIDNGLMNLPNNNEGEIVKSPSLEFLEKGAYHEAEIRHGIAYQNQDGSPVQSTSDQVHVVKVGENPTAQPYPEKMSLEEASARHEGFVEAIADTENRIPPYPGTVFLGENREPIKYLTYVGMMVRVTQEGPHTDRIGRVKSILNEMLELSFEGLGMEDLVISRHDCEPFFEELDAIQTTSRHSGVGSWQDSLPVKPDYSDDPNDDARD